MSCRFDRKRARTALELSRTPHGRAHLQTMLETHRDVLQNLDTMIANGLDQPRYKAEREDVRHNIGVLERALGVLPA